MHKYQLVLFDFDGVLVDTEEFHYRAYLKMCGDRGHTLTWSKQQYLRHALYTSSLKEALYQALPALYHEEPNWERLYQEKSMAYYQFLMQEQIPLMPAIEPLLQALAEADIKRAVVTHASLIQVEQLKRQHPLLHTIAHWITREDYGPPKPASDCYTQAITRWHRPKERVIGFEDSPRGLKALMGVAAIEPILVSEALSQDEVNSLAHDMEQQLGRHFRHIPSFSCLNQLL